MVTFEENSIKVKATIKETAVKFLHEAAGELVSAVKRNCEGHVDTGQTRGSYKYRVDKDNLKAVIGSDFINAIWEEFGTGSEAIHGDGRKGYWVYVKTSASPSETRKGGKEYTLEEAKQVMAILRSKGLEAHITKGKKANKPIMRAFSDNRSKIKRYAESLFGGMK